MTSRVLVVDDEPSIRKVLAAQLSRRGHDVLLAENAEDATAILTDQRVDVVVTDLKMPGMDGLELMRWIHGTRPAIPVILITAFGTVDTAVEALKQGAFDYVTKPFDQEDLLATVQKAAATARRTQHHLRSDTDADLIGESPAMRRVWEVIAKVAPSPASVLVTGENGTGKELVAKAIHRLSPRSAHPFIQVNCGAIPEDLFEEELFGRRPSDTGAPAKPGRVQLADGGTLFLDEVESLPRDMQVKLLRLLQEGEFDQAGGGSAIPADVRIIAASHEDLQRAVQQGAFREDLFYRLSVVPVHLAPLRERAEDLPVLIEHFVRRFAERFDAEITGLSDEALEALEAHAWPGNIRELENVIERAVLLADGPVLTPEDLAGFRPQEGEPLPDAREHDHLGLKEYLRLHTERLERHRIRRALEAEAGNVTRAARRLAISRRSLQTKMKDYGLRDH